jgi:hypothetical protein
LARIFLLKTLVTFLTATPSPVWMLVAALHSTISTASNKYHRWNQDLPYDTVGTLAELLRHIVLFVHDKVLVENLEDLATL